MRTETHQLVRAKLDLCLLSVCLYKYSRASFKRLSQCVCDSCHLLQLQV